MSLMLSMRVKWLLSEIDRWVADGLIGPDKADADQETIPGS